MLLMRFWTVESSFCSAATSFYFLLCVHFANPLEFRYTSPIPFYWALIGLCIERTLHLRFLISPLYVFDCYNKSNRCICRHCPNLSHQLRHNHIRGRLKTSANTNRDLWLWIVWVFSFFYRQNLLNFIECFFVYNCFMFTVYIIFGFSFVCWHTYFANVEFITQHFKK